ncbi:hypothetical protein [Calycomorphotria hydatis]|uniref:SPOR domain-containing protein n=1 Tax=Calycomorphotria hydatis TaxID=2528027 RepID=A0A517T4W1_9PLAN|nr:hypothetical protein [Calycomorphotria hydatis]QDT63423.1 hypothetical protein V22_06440 [Calycomorphotria hydatis]
MKFLAIPAFCAVALVSVATTASAQQQFVQQQQQVVQQSVTTAGVQFEVHAAEPMKHMNFVVEMRHDPNCDYLPFATYGTPFHAETRMFELRSLGLDARVVKHQIDCTWMKIACFADHNKAMAMRDAIRFGTNMMVKVIPVTVAAVETQTTETGTVTTENTIVEQNTNVQPQPQVQPQAPEGQPNVNNNPPTPAEEANNTTAQLTPQQIANRLPKEAEQMLED